MQMFGSPFLGLSNKRKLSDEELVLAIRCMVTTMYETTQSFMQLAEATNNKLAIEAFKGIANEERVHIRKFLSLLRELTPNEKKFYAESAWQDVEEVGKTAKPTWSIQANQGREGAVQ
ncbi:MAG: rubrerythrin [Chloroflexi bacterium HGW-Chloroflexi-10]|nr:MAG: rubrerythrin [Chloroflexi bacterium HGW-Chloroflexi-10]